MRRKHSGVHDQQHYSGNLMVRVNHNQTAHIVARRATSSSSKMSRMTANQTLRREMRANVPTLQPLKRACYAL